MTIKILDGSNNGFDFSAPIKMTKEQRGEFKELLDSMFDSVGEYETDYFRDDRMGDKRFFTTWEPKELSRLYGFIDNEEIAERLGRSYMSVLMKRAQFYPRFVFWSSQSGIDISKLTDQELEKLVRKYLEEKKLLQEKERKKRKEARKKEKRVENIIEWIEELIEDLHEPCMVGDSKWGGGECKNGFHRGCLTCPIVEDYFDGFSEVEEFQKIYLEYKKKEGFDKTLERRNQIWKRNI